MYKDHESRFTDSRIHEKKNIYYNMFFCAKMMNLARFTNSQIHEKKNIYYNIFYMMNLDSRESGFTDSQIHEKKKNIL